MLLGWSTIHPDAFCFLLPAALFTKDSLPYTLHLEIVLISTFGCIKETTIKYTIWWLLRKVNKFVVTAMASTLHSYATSSKLSNHINDFQVWRGKKSFLFRLGNKTEQATTIIHWSGPLRSYCTMVSQWVYNPMTGFVSDGSLNFNKIFRHHLWPLWFKSIMNTSMESGNNKGVSKEASLITHFWTCSCMFILLWIYPGAHFHTA